jgi:hypothetical protein
MVNIVEEIPKEILMVVIYILQGDEKIPSDSLINLYSVNKYFSKNVKAFYKKNPFTGRFILTPASFMLGKVLSFFKTQQINPLAITYLDIWSELTIQNKEKRDRKTFINSLSMYAIKFKRSKNEEDFPANVFSETVSLFELKMLEYIIYSSFNIRDDSLRRNALQVAIMNNCITFSKLIIEKASKEYLDYKDSSGATALHHAVARINNKKNLDTNILSIANLLINKGANTRIMTDAKEFPIDWIPNFFKDSKEKDIVELKNKLNTTYKRTKK